MDASSDVPPVTVRDADRTPAERRGRTGGLAWPWVAGGVAQGTILVLGLVPVWEFNGRADVVAVFAVSAFLLTGALFGYRSRGTLGETFVGGAVLVVLLAAILTLGLGYAVPPARLVAGAAAGYVLVVAGGLVGSVLRRAVLARERTDRSVSWPWVTVGVILGVMLNGSAVFVVSALFETAGFEWSGSVLALTFLGSFVATGLFVGYHAPGHSPRDAFLVAAGVVLVEIVLVVGVFRVPFPGLAIVAAAAVGFLLLMAGGWLGDRAWQLRARRRRRRES
jgi:hypothetical protein